MSPKTRMVLDYVQANLHRKLPLSEMAEHVGLSVSHLSHLFRTEVGMPPGRYLMSLRMQRARELLAGSLMSVKQVMIEVGFRDKSDFVRSFRKAYGVSPSEYRVKHLDSNAVVQDRKID